MKNPYWELGGGKILLFLIFTLINVNGWGQTLVSDVLTASALGVTNAGYADFKGKAFASGTLFAGNAMMTPGGAIQIRTENNNSGIVTTSSKGKVKSIVVTWNTGTTNGRVLNVYGKTKAYAAATDLYSTAAKQGELLGSLTYKSSASSQEARIDVDGDYGYIGIRSAKDPLYLDKVEIIWDVPTIVACPVLSSSAGTSFLETTTITATAEDGAVIYYTMDGESPTTSSERFPEGGLTISSTVTIKAMAVKDGVQSGVVAVTYTKQEPVSADGLTAIVFEKDGLYYAARNSMTTTAGVLDGEIVDIVNGKVLNPGLVMDIGWYVDEAAMTIKSVNNQYLAYEGSGLNLKMQSSKYVWYDKSLNKPWHVKDSKSGTERTLLYQGSGKVVKAYAATNIEYPDFSKELCLMPVTDGYVRSVSGASASAPRYGTICLPCDVETGDFSGANFYSVEGKVMKDGQIVAVALSEPLRKLDAGTPYMFCAFTDKVLVVYTGEPVKEAKSVNGLVGILNGTLDVPEGMYLMSNNTIQACGAGGKIASHRAYLDLDLMCEYSPTVGTNARLIVFDGTTGVYEVQKNGDSGVDVYRADGICVRRQVERKEALVGLPSGLYVVDGRKVTVK